MINCASRRRCWLKLHTRLLAASIDIDYRDTIDKVYDGMQKFMTYYLLIKQRDNQNVKKTALIYKICRVSCIAAPLKWNFWHIWL